ncbi:MAG: ABC transporter permease [Solirubrobacteraceae bacterium]|nr:ABC transporter permease [Solirubrobacteraceae bacterium]
MAATPTIGKATTEVVAPAGAGDRTATLRTWSLGLWSVFAILFLFLPIGVAIVFSFNEPAGRFNFTWQQFTFDHWLHPFADPDLARSLKNSVLLAVISTVGSVALGTLLAIALVRHRFRGRGTADFFVFLPMATPEVVLGASALGLFLVAGISTGFLTLVIVHIMFTISYVVVTVKARLQGMDPHIEEAARDLGASEWQAFWRVTMPTIAPGVVSAAVLAAALSVDDYVVSSFNAGQTQTFPLFIFGATRQGVPPEVNVLATMLLLFILAMLGLNLGVQKALARRDERRAAH